MPPKKDAKAEEVKEAEPEPQPHQLVGYGRFEYLGGVLYQGNWKLIDGAKHKHGWGKLMVSASEHYEGSFEADRMQGFGTYHYPDGCVYSGEWHEDKHDGRGRMEMANGTWYEGQWRKHLMHGQGVFRDHLGREWKGEFRYGVYGSRNQIQLVKEKVRAERDKEIKGEVSATVKELIGELQKDGEDSKRVLSYFEVLGCAGDIISGKLAQFKDRSKQRWLQLLKSVQGSQVLILQSTSLSKLIPAQRLKVRQLQGRGQVVEVFSKDQEGKGVALVQMRHKKWILAHACF